MNKTELALRFWICCFFLSSRKAGGKEGKADCSLASSPPPPPSSLDFFTASTDPSSFRQHWKHWNMQPNQTIVGPIAKQCLERLGQSPSLRSLETLVNAGIILGFNRSTTLTPSTHMYALWAHAPTQMHTQTHTWTLRHARHAVWAWLLIIASHIAELWCNTSCRGSFVDRVQHFNTECLDMMSHIFRQFS